MIWKSWGRHIKNLLSLAYEYYLGDVTFAQFWIIEAKLVFLAILWHEFLHKKTSKLSMMVEDIYLACLLWKTIRITTYLLPVHWAYCHSVVMPLFYIWLLQFSFFAPWPSKTKLSEYNDDLPKSWERSNFKSYNDLYAPESTEVKRAKTKFKSACVLLCVYQCLSLSLCV